MEKQNELKTSLAILSLEDSKHDFEIIQELLIDEGYDLKMDRVENEQEFVSALSDQKYDIILSDYNLPEYDAFAALKKAVEISPDIPFIVVSGTIGEVTAIELIKQGATDYVLKDNPERLPFTINRALEEVKEKVARKLSEEALRTSELKFRSIMENSADAILITDRNGRYIYTNAAVTNMLGFSAEEMKRKTIADLAPGDRINKYLDLFNLLLKEGKVTAEIELLKNDGKYISTDFNAVVLPDGISVYGSCRDITERKQAEVELIAAKEKAEESDRLKTAFLRNISHEVRTPMNAIVGFSDFLSNPDLPPVKQQGYIKIIVQSSKQLLSVITDIISIAIIEAGQEKINETDTNLNAICNLLNEKYILKAKKQNIHLSLKTTLPDNESLIITDETKLTEILSSIVDNALKFTKEGNVNFGYNLKDNFLEFYVEDSGIGIAPEMHEEIFERFRQAEITATRQYGGSGLGLSISKAFVEMLGGKIWLTSEPGKGSMFYFTIPYKKVQQDLIPGGASSVEIGIEAEKQKTLLIAEDEIFNFMYIEELLSGKNFTIIRAENGIEAIEICKANPNIDLVLMDIKMPAMDGYEATKQIKEFRPNLPIIAQTAYSTEAEKRKTLSCGCSDFISKPFKKEMLLSKISEQMLMTPSPSLPLEGKGDQPHKPLQ